MKISFLAPSRLVVVGLASTIWLTNGISPVRAADKTYDDGGETPVWDLTTENWLPGPTTWMNGDVAIFGGTGSDIDIDAEISAVRLRFTAGSYSLGDAEGNGSLALTGTGTGSTAAISLTSSVTGVTISENIVLGAANGSTQTFDMGSGANLTVSGNITENPGAGIALNLNGSAIVTLSGNNSHTGGTETASSGVTININHANALGTGALTLKASGSPRIDNTSGAAITVANGLTLSGPAVGVPGTGNMIFLGTHDLTFTGAVTLKDANKSIEVKEDWSTLTLGGAIGEDGSSRALIKRGPGTLVLTSANSTYSGLTHAYSGTLEVKHLSNGGQNSSIGTSDSAASNLVVENTATFLYTGAGSSTDRLFTITHGGSGSTIASSGTGALRFTNTGALAHGGNLANTRLLILRGTNTDNNTLALAIGNSSGGGATSLKKDDGGKWILTGTSTYTGDTNVVAGTLLIDGDHSLATGKVSVSAGATLGGAGTIGGNTTIASGGFLVVSGEKTPHFNSNLSFHDTSTLLFTGGGPIEVDGTLDLDNNWTLSLSGDLQDGGSLVLFTYGTLASSPALTPVFDISQLGFIPSDDLVLIHDTVNKAILLEGVSLAAIPEPSTWVFLFGAAGALGFCRRFRKVVR